MKTETPLAGSELSTGSWYLVEKMNTKSHRPGFCIIILPNTCIHFECGDVISGAVAAVLESRKFRAACAKVHFSIDLINLKLLR